MKYSIIADLTTILCGQRQYNLDKEVKYAIMKVEKGVADKRFSPERL